jgi:hypothetical protein
MLNLVLFSWSFILVVLKLTGILHLSWFWVLSPAIAGILFTILVILLAIFLYKL